MPTDTIHAAEVQEFSAAGPTGSTRCYKAWCPCGWSARVEYDWLPAALDRRAHMLEHQPPPGRRPAQVGADHTTVDVLGDLIHRIKADPTLHQRAVAAWSEALLPERGAALLSQEQADKALEVLGKVWAER